MNSRDTTSNEESKKRSSSAGREGQDDEEQEPGPPSDQQTSRTSTPSRKVARTHQEDAKDGADIPEAQSNQVPLYLRGFHAPSASPAAGLPTSSSMPSYGLLSHQQQPGVPFAAPFLSGSPANQQQNLDPDMRQRIFESFQQSQQPYGLRPPAASLTVQQQQQNQQSGLQNISADQLRQMYMSMQQQRQQAMQNPLIALSSMLAAPAQGGAASNYQQNALFGQLMRQSRAVAAPSSHQANALEQLLRQQQFQEQLAASNPQQQQGGLLDNQFATSASMAGAAGLLQQQQRQQPQSIFDSFFQSQQQQQQLPFVSTQHAQAMQALLAAQGQSVDRQQQQPPRLAANQQAVPTSKGIPLALPSDVNQLSGYQIFIRHQLEFFVSEQSDCDTNVQGRKKRVKLGQIGIRCRHCAHTPVRQRGRGSVYYPQKLMGVYQAAQNMATTHLAIACLCIPEQTRQELMILHKRRDTASGGKIFWANACISMGMTEDDDGIRFRSDEAMERALAGNYEEGGGATSKQSSVNQQS